MSRRAGELVLAFLAGVAVTHVLASVSQSLLVMAVLERAGAEFSLSTRLHVIGHDIVGLIVGGEFSFAGAIMISFLFALPVAEAARRFTRVPLLVAYPIAGAAALAAVLGIVQANFFYNMTLMEGTRGVLGHASQLMSGAAGAAAFALLLRRWGRVS
jgi:hypothetical protein